MLNGSEDLHQDHHPEEAVVHSLFLQMLNGSEDLTPTLIHTAEDHTQAATATAADQDQAAVVQFLLLQMLSGSEDHLPDHPQEEAAVLCQLLQMLSGS